MPSLRSAEKAQVRSKDPALQYAFWQDIRDHEEIMQTKDFIGGDGNTTYCLEETPETSNRIAKYMGKHKRAMAHIKTC